MVYYGTMDHDDNNTCSIDTKLINEGVGVMNVKEPRICEAPKARLYDKDTQALVKVEGQGNLCKTRFLLKLR